MSSLKSEIGSRMSLSPAELEQQDQHQHQREPLLGSHRQSSTIPFQNSAASPLPELSEKPPTPRRHQPSPSKDVKAHLAGFGKASGGGGHHWMAPNLLWRTAYHNGRVDPRYARRNSEEEAGGVSVAVFVQQSGETLFHYFKRLRGRRPWLSSWILFGTTLTIAVLFLYHLMGFVTESDLSGLDHPIPKLLQASRAQYEASTSNRSSTLAEAYQTYIQNHPLSKKPPKGFDTWFHQAKKHQACNIDSYTSMKRDMLIWWAMLPKEIRERMDEMGSVTNGDKSNALGRVSIRNGKLVSWEQMGKMTHGGLRGLSNSDARRSLEDVLAKVMTDWGIALPDVDFMVNGLDEPRVIIPYETRHMLENYASRNKMISYDAESIKAIRWNEIGDKSGFSVIRTTCPLSSRARMAPLTPSPGTRPVSEHTYDSAFTTEAGHFLSRPDLERSTWCEQPDLQDLHATFIKPLSFSYTQSVVPVFSNSKISGFNDMLLPPWYVWYDWTPYKETEDVEWKAKSDDLFWRGSNTGGKALGTNWMGWLRSRIVSMLNKPKEWKHYNSVLWAGEDDKILQATLPTTVLNEAYTDVKFSSPDRHGDVESLKSQKAEPSFKFSDTVPFRENYGSKAVLDLDGTAYSGRFISLMRSRSAVFKSRLYMEALDDSLIPWYHYVPLSIRSLEIYDLLGYFFGSTGVIQEIKSRNQRRVRMMFKEALTVKGLVDTGNEANDEDDQRKPAKLSRALLGKASRAVPHEMELKAIAEQGREWGLNCARKEDFMVYTHLLTLEWTRLCHDGRDKGEADFTM